MPATTVQSEPFMEASRELRGRFYSLIDSLAALRGLTDPEIHHRAENDFLSSALDLLIHNRDLERCSIFLVEDGRLECVAGSDWDDLFGPLDDESKRRAGGEPVSFAVGEGIMGEAARKGEIVHCHDCATDTRFKANGSALSVTTGSLISSPILSGRDVLGVVNVYHPDASFFEDWHEHSLTLYCSVLGHMLEKNRLLRRMEKAVEDRTRQLEAALREAEQLKRRYEQLSNVDELTSLHNRRYFYPEAEAVLARAIRYGHRFSLVLIDVDEFKNINDKFGHSTGDAVLRHVAAALRAQIRDGDIIVRFGGEEFVIALPNTGLEGARPLANRVRTTIAASVWEVESRTIRVTVSLGLTDLGERHSGNHRQLLETLLKEADEAMYYCKSHGRNQICAFQDLPPSPA